MFSELKSKSEEEQQSKADKNLELQITSLNDLSNQHYHRINNKIDLLEHEIGKLGVKTQDVSTANTITRVRNSLERNNADIKFINGKIDDLQRLLDKKKDTSDSTDISQEAASIEKISTLFQPKVEQPQDLTQPLTELQQIMAQFEHDYSQKLFELDQRTNSIDESIDELDGMIDELTGTTSEIELHTKEAETLCKELSDAISKIRVKLNDDTENIALQKLALQIQQLSSSTRNELNSLNNKMRKIELDIPL